MVTTPAPLAPRFRVPDAWIMGIVAVLAVTGMVIAASARVFEDAVGGGGAVPMGIAKSFAHLLAGLLAMALMLIPDYRRLAEPGVAWALLLLAAGLLGAALFSPAVGNTHRWIRVGGVSMQPSEAAKVVLVIVVAAALCRTGDKVATWQGLLRPLALGGFLTVLVLLGKDLGTPVLMFATTLLMCFVAGARLKHAGALLAGGVGVAAVATALFPYRVARVMGFLQALRFDAETLNDVPYQLRQSLIAIGSGGLLGKGFGGSTQKAFFLPEADNDFIFAVVTEELGLVGALLVVLAFLVLAWRGIRVAEMAQDELGRLIAAGVTFLLCGQALCHMGVVTGILPTKGLTLPFFSSGGWSLIVSCALAGLLLNVSLRRRPYAA